MLRLVIGGTQSSVGKTTVATALMAALNRRGMRVQAFKVGPDFIDPSFHKAATGRPGRNLDGWMLERATNSMIFEQSSAGADIAVVEGMMGLFDGCDGATGRGSTAEMAKWLQAPVVLVLDASALAHSAAAIVKGFEDFDPELEILGIIFNRVAGKGHFDILRDALAGHCRALPLGYLTQDNAVALPERHLGLVMAEEALAPERLLLMAGWIESTLSIDALLDRVRSHSAVRDINECRDAPVGRLQARARVGIARDHAFCFYYQDNLDLLESLGGELIEFSPLADANLPDDLDGIYLGGGYPELHAPTLAANQALREEISAFARSGAPLYAECGGLMYLTEAIVDTEGQSHPMAGVFPTRARMRGRLAAIGYAEVEVLDKSNWLPAGERARGHEFRYSEIDAMPCDVPRNYRVHTGNRTRSDGYSAGAVVASYIHLHFLSCPSFAAGFITACAAHRASKLREGTNAASSASAPPAPSTTTDTPEVSGKRGCNPPLPSQL
jgi:cobyrinic acid a,c-diamide synthase